MGTMLMNIPAAQQVVLTYVSDLPYVIALPVSFLLLCILLVYASRATEERRLYVVILQFLAVFIAWISADSHILHVLYPDEAFWHHVSLALLFLVPVSGNYVAYAVLEPERREGVRTIVAIDAFAFVLATLGECMGIGGYVQAMPFLYGVLPFFEGYVLYQFFQSARQGNERCRALIVVFVIVTVLGLFDGLNVAMKFTPQPTHIMPLGVFSFFLVILQFLQDQLVREHALENQTANLAYRAALAQERSEIDPLTGCRNRLSFEMAIREAITDVRQTGRPLAFLMFDIDHFKQYNDTYGHEAGDEVLKRFSGVVRQMLDKEKPFFRWGGEEFVVILSGADLDEAAVVGNTIRRKVAEEVVVRGQHVTVSIGASTWHGTLDTEEHLFQRADAALYTAKGEGRNCLRVEAPGRMAKS